MDPSHDWKNRDLPLNRSGSRPLKGAHIGRSLSLARTRSAIDMRQLTTALLEAREGTGEIRDVLCSASFKPRLPGLTKIVSRLSKEGAWRKALEVYEACEEMGVVADTALTNSAISACDKGSRWTKALEIFESMERMNLNRDAITYSATISSLAKGKQWHAALQVFEHMQANGVAADVVTCCSLINALERGGQWRLAEKLFLQMCTVGGGDGDDGIINSLGMEATSPEASQNCNSATSQADGIVRLLRSQTSPTSVLSAVKASSSSDRNPTPPDASPLLPPGLSLPRPHSATKQEDRISEQTIADANTDKAAAVHPDGQDGVDDESLSSVFKKVMSATATTNNNTVAVCEDTTIAQRPSSAGATPFASSAALARGSSLAANFGIPQIIPEEQSLTGDDLLLSQLQPSSSSSFQRSISSRGIKGTALRKTLSKSGLPAHQAATSNHLRRALSCYPDLDPGDEHQEQQQQQEGSLESMFTFSHAAKVTPNRVCCNALLAAYARAKPPQWKKASHLLAAMWGGGDMLRPDAVSYNTVLKACANAFQVGRAMDIFREMVSNAVVPNCTTVSTLISAACEAGNTKAMKEIGNWLDRAPPDVRAGTINIYVVALVKVGSWDAAVALYRSMLSPTSIVHPTSSTFNAIMNGFLKQNLVDDAKKVFQDMVKTGGSPTIVTYNTLLAAQANEGAWLDALETLQSVFAARTQGVHSNTRTFNYVLAAMEKAVNNTNTIIKQQGHHDSEYLSQQQTTIATQALQVYHLMQQAGGGFPDAATFIHLIRILAGAGRHSQVLAVYEVVVSQGHSLDVETASAVIEAATASNQVQRAVGLVNGVHIQGLQLEASVITNLLTACIKANAWDQACALSNSVFAAQQLPQGQNSATAMFNFTLNAAANARQFNIAIDIVTIMQNANLEVDPEVSTLLSQLSSPERSESSRQSHNVPSPNIFIRPQASLPANFEYHTWMPSTGEIQTTRPQSTQSAFATPPRPSVTRTMSLPGGGPGMPQLPTMRQLSYPLPPMPPTSQGSSNLFSLIDDNPHASYPGGGYIEQEGIGSGYLTLSDTNAILRGLEETGDAAGTLEVLRNMHTVGIKPDKCSYETAIRTLIAAQQPHAAVEICEEAHDSGVLARYFASQQHNAVHGVVDLRDVDKAVGLTVVLTWTAKVLQLRQRGIHLNEPTVKFVVSSPEGGGSNNGNPGAFLPAEEVINLLIGHCSIECVKEVMPVSVPAYMIRHYRQDSSSLVIEIPATGIYPVSSF